MVIRQAHRAWCRVTGLENASATRRSIVTYVRTLYDDHEFSFAGPYGENGFLEDYTARVRGEQLGNVVLVTNSFAPPSGLADDGRR
jgi:hypothetical protein